MTGGSLVDDDVAGSSGERVGAGEGVESFGTAGSGTGVAPVTGTVDVAALADSGTEVETGAEEGVRSPSSDDEQPTSRRPAATVDTTTRASRRRGGRAGCRYPWAGPWVRPGWNARDEPGGGGNVIAGEA